MAASFHHELLDVGAAHGAGRGGREPGGRGGSGGTGGDRLAAGPVTSLIYAEPANGITDSQHHILRADGATYEGPPTEKNESDRIEWVPMAYVRGMIDHRKIVSSGSLVGLLYVLMGEAIR